MISAAIKASTNSKTEEVIVPKKVQAFSTGGGLAFLGAQVSE